MGIVEQWFIKNESGIVTKIITLSYDKITTTGTFRVTKPYCVDVSQDIGLEQLEFAETYSNRFSKKSGAMKVIRGILKQA